MRFQVPQFIETEVKLVGPFTLKQFIWVAFGAILLYIIYLLIQGPLFFIIAIPLGSFFAALAFVRINGAPLVNYALYAVNYILNPKRYLYTKSEDQNQIIYK